MKNHTKVSTISSQNSRRLLETIFTMVLMMPAVALSQSSPAPVDLGTSGNFVILAKTGVSTTGVTAITGDVGVSPTDSTAITGFDLILDASGQWATSSLVAGKLYAADYAPPTPTMLTAAVSDMETAYTDAAGRTLPDYTELYSGDITGQTLTHGLYKWGTGVLISAGGVTISGTASDVWIFQIAQDLTVDNGAIVTLIGGAQSSNIFWQVAGQVTLGTTSDFKGNVLCQTLIAMQTSGTFNGRALAQTAVTLDASTVTLAGDADNDGMADGMDNCTLVANADQRDTDQDNIGNACDADIFLPNNCVVNFLDLGTMKAAFFSNPTLPNWNANADFDGNNSVNFLDLGTMKAQFFGPPGPSAAGCN